MTDLTPPGAEPAWADSLIDALAPTLRGLLGGRRRLPTLMVEPGAAPQPGDLVLALAPGTDPDDGVGRLTVAVREHLARTGTAAAAIAIPGLARLVVGDEPSGTAPVGRAAGRVAVITGAAQGFGLAIAEGLAAEGAHVVLADLNVALATTNARAIEARFGAGRALAVAMDVTDEASVAAGMRAVVRRFGGLDLLVSNAGVLRAGAVTTQPLADFDLVTRVNYRGYFLAVRFAAPILARQHRANPAWWGDIVEINSKSGLAGSSRNSAYAGSKFGGVGLTQSFALELVGDGIKVNAICPGNYLDGPLWSDPANGLFVQYLRTGKVPGASGIEDVRRAYEAKVPMGRGCDPADVLEALHYLVAQQYETGQALPVTGGQVMLS
ncbi:MAG TPA: SDR family NAD(P)-dependent oxidoreductase [Candidatus Limnocylindrales bacterium]|nr:SDR family NAD(P)-dependent oxidoreductase [Candidatus Limnocylindrales bacterium]